MRSLPKKHKILLIKKLLRYQQNRIGFLDLHNIQPMFNCYSFYNVPITIDA